jgi:hypothetical protein
LNKSDSIARDQLISFSVYSFPYTDSVYKFKHGIALSPTPHSFIEQQNTDTLTIKFNFRSGSASWIGKTAIKGDSLFLIYKLKDKENIAKRLTYYTLTYKIKNPDRKQYKIRAYYSDN